jgi:hypothetical protein
LKIDNTRQLLMMPRSYLEVLLKRAITKELMLGVSLALIEV